MEEDEEYALGGGPSSKGTLGGGSYLRKGTRGEGSDIMKETRGVGLDLIKETRGVGWNSNKETRGGGSVSRTETQGGGLRLMFQAGLKNNSQEGDTCDQKGSVQYSRKDFAQSDVHGRQRLRKEEHESRLRVHEHRGSTPSDSEELPSAQPSGSRYSRTRRVFGGTKKRSAVNDTSESRSESPPPKRVRLSRYREGERDIRLMDKFLAVLEKVKTSDKPKLAFNVNVVPEFDPLDKNQSVLTWITKVEECAEIYGWGEREIIHYSLPKLCGVAKTWYQGLTSVLHTWSEWKKKLLESFPCREDYAELLTEMLAKKVKYGESLEHYYYSKVNLLNRCKITGKQAVDCLLYGVEDRAVKVGAQAAQFRQPEEVLKYFKTVKIGLSRDNQDTMRRGKIETNANRVDSSKPGNIINPSIRCYNCNEVGHPSFRCKKFTSSVKCHNCNEVGHRSFKCDKPLSKCTVCDRVGHLTSNCYKNTGRSVAEASKSMAGVNVPSSG